mmetsp:Transcript_40973/g.49867  ORF Transcript_40973/g.49867 Transcript_40973/m.49867 type:complete len:285 (-) Transcript_40973:143-997(-)
MKKRFGQSLPPKQPLVTEYPAEEPSLSSSLSRKYSPPNSRNSDTTIPIGQSNFPTTPSENEKMSEFDVLKREATKLERHLEDRVAKYQQLAQRITAASANNSNPYASKHTNRPSSLLDAAETGSINSPANTEEESTLSNDISRTISQMSEIVNKRMAPAAEVTGRNQHLLLVKRYREILFDRTTDYEKTRAAMARKRETMELFAGANTGDGGDGEVDHLLRERNAIGNSMKGVSSVLGQAEEIRADLKSQGMALRGVSGKVLAIAGGIPGVNKLIENIRKKEES